MQITMFALYKEGKLPFHRNLEGSLEERRDRVVRATCAHFGAHEMRWAEYEECIPDGVAARSAGTNRRIAADEQVRNRRSSAVARVGTELGIIVVDVPAN